MQSNSTNNTQTEKEPKEDFIVLVCPLCHLPLKKCSAARSYVLKFGDTPNQSGKIQSELLRKFHAPFCKTCRNPVECCRKRKVRKAISRYKRMFGLQQLPDDVIDTYLTPGQITELADKEKCRRPKVTGTPEIPRWYIPGEYTP